MQTIARLAMVLLGLLCGCTSSVFQQSSGAGLVNVRSRTVGALYSSSEASFSQSSRETYRIPMGPMGDQVVTQTTQNGETVVDVHVDRDGSNFNETATDCYKRRARGAQLDDETHIRLVNWCEEHSPQPGGMMMGIGSAGCMSYGPPGLARVYCGSH